VCQGCSERRHPTFPEVRICSRCYSKIIVAQNKLQKAAWYHGPLKRATGEKRLKEAGTRLGDYLVRESASVDGFIALSVRTDKTVLHYLIKEKFGHWYLGAEPTQANQKNMYPTIQSLITECKGQYNLLRAMIVKGHSGPTCPNCAANINDEMEFCEECGTRLRSTKEQLQIYDDQGAEDLVYDDDMQFPNADGTYDDDGTGGGGGAWEAQGDYDDSGPDPHAAHQHQHGVPAGGESAFCHACGSGMVPGMAFCSDCGTPRR